MDGVELINIETLGVSQQGAVATMHCAEMPRSMLSRLGPAVTKKFYASIGRSSQLFGTAAIVEGRIGGAVVGTPSPNTAFEAVTAPLPIFVLRVLRRRPTMLPRLVWSKLRPAHDVARPARSVELLYIFTDRRRRGAGIGKALLARFFDDARTRGLDRVTLSVEVDNDAAIGLYERRGFDIVAARQREGGHLCHRMSAPI